MRYYLERKDGRRVTFEVARDGIDAVLVMAPGKEERQTKAQARATWSRLVKEGAFEAQCYDPEGHDGECCTCRTVAATPLAIALEKERLNPHVKGGNGKNKPLKPYVKAPSSYVPEPGTKAFMARLLVECGALTGDEADDWKDQMKDTGEYHGTWNGR